MRYLGLTIAVVAICVAGCGGSGGNPHSQPPASRPRTTAAATPPGDTGSSGSFVGRAINAAVFVTWTQTNGQLSGELQQGILQGSGSQESVNNESISFTGNVSGSSVTLTLDQGLGTTTNLTGSLSDGVLELNYPGANGTVLALTLKPGTASDYNVDLAGLQADASTATTEARRAAKAQQQQVAAQQVASEAQQAAQAVRGDMSTLESDTEALANGNFYNQDLASEQKDVSQTEADMQTVLNEGSGSETVCSDSGTVDSDVGAVQSDVGAIQSDQGASQSSVAAVDDDVTQLRRDAQTLDRDPAAMPAGAPTRAEVSAAVSAAAAAIATANKNATNALAQANAMETTAAAYQKKADAVCSSASS